MGHVVADDGDDCARLYDAERADGCELLLHLGPALGQMTSSPRYKYINGKIEIWTTKRKKERKTERGIQTSREETGKTERYESSEKREIER